MKQFKFSSKVREVLTPEELRQITDNDSAYKCICDFYHSDNFLEEGAYTQITHVSVPEPYCDDVCKDKCKELNWEHPRECIGYKYRVEIVDKDGNPITGSGSGSEGSADEGSKDEGSDGECSGSDNCGSGYCDECSCGCDHLCYGSCSCGDACTCGSVGDVNRP